MSAIDSNGAESASTHSVPLSTAQCGQRKRLAIWSRTVDDPLLCRHSLDLTIVNEPDPAVGEQQDVARVAIACHHSRTASSRMC